MGLFKAAIKPKNFRRVGECIKNGIKQAAKQIKGEKDGKIF